MNFLIRWLSQLPLPWLQRIGVVLGWLTWWFSPRYRRQFQDQAQQAGYTMTQLRGAIWAAGAQTLESFRVWFGAPMPVQWRGEHHITQAYDRGKGVVFVTPHLGCFEITAPTCALRFGPERGPLTVLYRPPRQAWLRDVLVHARDKPFLKAVPASMDGVRQLIKALRRGQSVGLLPDQVPPQGMGVWSRMWGRPAYTMTLAARLAMQTDAQIVLAWGERLPRGQGYCLHFEPMAEKLSEDLETAVLQINLALEGLIRQCPQQYLWGYARFKQPRDEVLH
ncbi:MAG: lysophospholipid acyltransferase family protein [Limnohabitans sp.]